MQKLPTPRTLLIAVVVVGLYALIGFVGLPYAIKTYVVPMVAEHLDRPVVVREVDINPFALSVRLAGVEIQETNQTPMLGFEEFFVNFQVSSLVRRAYVFDEIRLVMPFVSVRVLPGGKVNLLELVRPATEPEAAEPGRPPADDQHTQTVPPIEIGHLSIAQGVLEFRDESKPRPFALDIVPIKITLRNFSTRRGGENAYAFTAEIGQGETLAWEGTVSLDPLESQGRVSLSGLKLKTLWQYVQDRFAFDLTDGVLNVSGRYHFDTQAQPFNLLLTEGKVALSEVTLGEKDAPGPLITIPGLAVENIQVDLSKRNVDIGAVQVDKARFRAWLNENGSINYQTMFATTGTDRQMQGEKTSSANASSAPPSDSSPWSVLVKDVGVHNTSVVFEDRRTKTPVQVDLEGMEFAVKDVRVPVKDPLAFGLSFKVNQAGKVDVRGNVAVEPLAADLDLSLSQLAIKPFQPYLDQFVRVDVASGAIGLDGKVRYAQVHPQSPLLSYQGNVAVTNLSVLDRSALKEFLSWKSVALNKLAVDLLPTSLRIGEVALQELAAHVQVLPDGGLNLSHLMAVSDQAVDQPAESTADSKRPVKQQNQPVPITIETVRLAKVQATFTDQSIQPNVATGLHDLTGTIKGLSSKEMAKADVVLAGKVDKIAPLKITGKINPLSEGAFTDLLLTFDNMDLVTVSPYAGKYAGYPITKGKLFLDLQYKISKKQLAAENKLVLDQLTFGSKTDSPDATKLPVPLAVALLKDRQGRIDIDVPIRGDLNDPDFKYGRAVLKALINLLTKLVMSPFSALGSVIGGEGDSFAFVEFAPGHAELSADEAKKLESLAKGLAARPGLRLEIAGTADQQRDRLGLAQEKLQAELRRAKLKELGQPLPPPGSEPQSVSLTKDDEARFLGALYAQRIGSAPEKAGGPSGSSDAKTPPLPEEMRQRLLETIPIEKSELRALAHTRAKQVREQLVVQHKVPEEQVYLLEADMTGTGNENVRTKLALTGGRP